jgi:nucleoside permease NupC
MNALSIIRSSLVALISSIARNLLVTGLTWLVARKVIDESASSQIVTILPVAIGAIAWSVVEKYVLTRRHMRKLLAALDLPAGSSVADVEKEMGAPK